MNTLNGPFVVIVLSIREGRGFDFLKKPLIIESILDKNVIESDPADPNPNPTVCTEFVWETQKKEVRRLRSSHVSIRINCYTFNEDKERDKIGFILLNLRSAQPVTNTQVQDVGFKWHKLANVRKAYKVFNPELSFTLTIRDKLYHEGQINQEPITPCIQQIITEPEIPEIIEDEEEEDEEVLEPVFTEDGWIQLGKKLENSQKYILKFIVDAAYNLDLLLDKDQVFNSINEKYYLSFTILGLTINTNYFYKNLHEPVPLKDKIIFKLQTNLALLKKLLDTLETIPISFNYGAKTLATARIDIKDFITNTDEIIFKEEHSCEFYSLVNNLVPNGPNNRKPYVTLEILLEQFSHKMIIAGTKSNDNMTFKSKYGTDFSGISTVSETGLTKKSSNSTSEVPTSNKVSETIKNVTEENSLTFIPTETVIIHDSAEIINKIIESNPQLAKKNSQQIDEPRQVQNEVEVKFNSNISFESQSSGSSNSVGNLRKSNEEITINSSEFITNQPEIIQKLSNADKKNLVNVTNSTGEILFKTVNSVLMETLNACGDQINVKNTELIKINGVNTVLTSEDAAVQTTPRHCKVTKSKKTEFKKIPGAKKSLTTISTTLVTDDEVYRLYCLEVEFNSITWKKEITTNGFQFKINHPKASNVLVICCDLKDMKYKQTNILLDDVFFHLYFISTEKNILQLVAMYPPKIAIQTLSDNNLVEDFELYTKLLLNQNTKFCSYFAVPNSLWNDEEIVCDIQVHMKINPIDMNDHIFKSEFDLEPVILDDYFAMKTLTDLATWKEKQEILFEDKLRHIQCEKLELLQAEWNLKRIELESKLKAGLEKCKALAMELNSTADAFRMKKKAGKEAIQQQVTQIMEEEMKQTVRRLENEKFELLKNIEQLKFEKNDLDKKIRQKDAELEEIRKTTLTSEQTKLVFKELRCLEEKFQEALMEKAFFKEEWHKALKEAHALKSEDQKLIQEEIRKKKQELTKLNLNKFLDEDETNYENVNCQKVSSYVF